MSPYQDKKILYVTKHAKYKQAARLFKAGLGAEIVPSRDIDTDILGTFSGEVERSGNALVTAARKCALGLEQMGMKIGIASEGSFGPHPVLGFVPAGREILYFIDQHRDFETHEYELFGQTNYEGAAIESLDDLERFMKRTRFPSHACILRPNIWNDKSQIIKAIQDYDQACSTFDHFKAISSDNKVWAETDMRAHLNPTRRRTLIKLSKKLVRRLARLCPSCQMPGWGIIDYEAGLPCELCTLPTDSIKADIWGCVKCDYKETDLRAEKSVSSRYCGICNP